MVDYPVKDYTMDTGKVIQVFDKTKSDEIKDLNFIKVFPYVLLAYSIIMTIPYLLWTNICALDIKENDENLLLLRKLSSKK